MFTKKTNQQEVTLAVGDVVEGKVLAIDRNTIYIDLPPVGTGIIYGREFLIAKDILSKTHVGDTIKAKIIALETSDGKYIDLSLKEARQALIWAEAEEAMRTNRVYEVVSKSANRGGLIISWNGIRGFLPASQLSEEHYPKILSANKDAILTELNKLVGEKISVTIMDINPKEEHLILSEHTDKKVQREDGTVISETPVLAVGDIKIGVVTGVVDFGIFVKIDSNSEGLVHISEMDWGLVDDPHRFYSVGDQVTVKVIELQDDKYSFSIKALRKNPWETVSEKYSVNDTVTGVVLKYNTHGVFASIEAGVSGLVHISCFKDEEDLRQSLEIGKTYEFVITHLNSEEQKLTLVPKNKHKENKD